MNCSYCGSKMPDDSTFCPLCGAPSPSAAAEKAKEGGPVISKVFDADAAPADKVDIDAAPADKADIDAAPADKVDIDAAPADKADLDAAPADKADMDAAPADKADMDAAPADKADMYATPADKADMDAAPADKADMDAAPAEIINPDKGDKGAALGGVPGADRPNQGAAFGGVPGADRPNQGAAFGGVPGADRPNQGASFGGVPGADRPNQGASFGGVPGADRPNQGASFGGVPGADRPNRGAAFVGAADRQNIESRPSDTLPGKKEKFGRKKILTICGVVLIAILAVVLFKVFEHNNKVKKYNEGVAQLESKNYGEALETFTGLGSFEDSEYMASYAQMELDYLTLDDLAAAGDFSRVVEILKSRIEFYGDSDTGKEAAALADEYKIVSAAYSAMKSGEYSQAMWEFDSLTRLKNDYAKDKCLCSAYISEEAHDWVDEIFNLYAIQDNDTNKDFLQNPQGEGETMLSEAFHSKKHLDPDKVAELLQTEDEELEAMKTKAISGLRYNDARELLDDRKYEDAMEAFKALGDFQDSAALYEEAKAGYEACKATYAAGEKYYDNKEYYKARKEFLSISGYKDADDKAKSCVQPMPESGSLKSGNGSIAFTIYAPDIKNSVFVKIYNSDDDTVGQVFLNPNNNSTVSLAAGTYTIKVAYGSEWYGEIDLFGDSGDYYQLLNGSGTEFDVLNGYSYTLELVVSTGGNVGHRSLGGAGNM